MKHLIAVATACLTLSGAAEASPITDAFSSFVVLGDSLSDNGNLFGIDG
ncbi:MAG: hypothetical protein AAGA08_00365 [Pseudomonadota bacterium]